VSLGEVDAEQWQQLDRRLPFSARCDHFLAECARDSDQCADEYGARLVVFDTAHERAIELHEIDRQRAQARD
jgi:hypothetical protein